MATDLHTSVFVETGAKWSRSCRKLLQPGPCLEVQSVFYSSWTPFRRFLSNDQTTLSRIEPSLSSSFPLKRSRANTILFYYPYYLYWLGVWIIKWLLIVQWKWNIQRFLMVYINNFGARTTFESMEAKAYLRRVATSLTFPPMGLFENGVAVMLAFSLLANWIGGVNDCQSVDYILVQKVTF